MEVAQRRPPFQPPAKTNPAHYTAPVIAQEAMQTNPDMIVAQALMITLYQIV